MAQDSGIRDATVRYYRGLELDAGELGCFEHRIDATMRSPATNADTYRYEFTNAGYSVRVRFTGDARWFDLRAVPRRAWLGGGDPLPRPSSHLLIGCNDNRRHAAPSSGHRRAATFGNSAVIHDLSS